LDFDKKIKPTLSLDNEVQVLLNSNFELDTIYNKSFEVNIKIYNREKVIYDKKGWLSFFIFTHLMHLGVMYG
jgi:hypothetical protein